MNSDTATVKSEYPTKSERREAFVVREHFVQVEDRPVERRAWLADMAKRGGLRQDIEKVSWFQHDFVSRSSSREQIMLVRPFDSKTVLREAVFRMRDMGYSPASRLQQAAYIMASPSLLKAGEKLATFGEFIKSDSYEELYPVFVCHQLSRLSFDFDDCHMHDPNRLFLFVRDTLKR